MNSTLRSLWETHRGRCSYCTQRMRKAHATIDHYLPKKLGGTNDRGNLRLACVKCNHLKADMHPDDWERVRPRFVVLERNRIDIRNELLRRCAPFARRETA